MPSSLNVVTINEEFNGNVLNLANSEAEIKEATGLHWAEGVAIP